MTFNMLLLEKISITEIKYNETIDTRGNQIVDERQYNAVFAALFFPTNETCILYYSEDLKYPVQADMIPNNLTTAIIKTIGNNGEYLCCDTITVSIYVEIYM